MTEEGGSLAGWQAPPMPGPDVMEGRWVRLERLDPDRHAAGLFAAVRGHDRLWDFLGYGPFADATAYRAWAEGMAGLADPFFYTLVDRATGRPGGVASYLRTTPAHGTIEVGHICLAPALQGSRAATEAMVLMADWAFAAGYRRYEWKCDARNLPSRRAAERLGFSFEGIFRQHMIVKGRNRDTAWFAMTDGDWQRIASVCRAWLEPANFTPDGRQLCSLSGMTRPLLAARDPLLVTPGG
jgi:RimJ/RimL family protein N-acetyltransferase